DGSTTFNLPNLSRRSTIGSGGTGTGTVGNAVGDIGGEENHTLTAAESAQLTYTTSITDPGHAHSGGQQSFTGNQALGGGAANGPNQNTGTSTTGITASTSSNAGGGAHNTYHPVAVVLKCIKT